MIRPMCVVVIFLIWAVDAAQSRAMPNSMVTALALRVPREAAVSSSTSTAIAINLDPNMPWEEKLMPSPMVVALLGQLMVISGKIDFPLTESTPKDGFKYMRHPESFRASLVQVSNDGWSAFMVAHKNMDRIQLYMQQIPAQAKTTMKILSSASTRLIRVLLPMTLKRIQDIGQTCVDLSAETELKFVDVIMLIRELLEATESSRGMQQQKLAQVQIELNVTAERKKMIERLGEDLKARQDMIDAEVAKRRALYDEAVSQIPTGWKALVQDLGRAVVGVVKFLPQMFMSFSGGLIGGRGGGGGISSPRGGGAGGASGPPPEDFQRASTLGLFRNFFDSINGVKNTVLQALNGKLPSSSQTPTDLVPSVKVLLDQFEKGFQTARSDLTIAAVGFIDEARALMNGDVKVQLENVLSSIAVNPSKVISGFEGLLDRMKRMDAQASVSAPPGELMAPMGGGDSDGGSSSCTGCSERYIANLQMEALKQSERRQDQIFQEMMKYHEEMKELVSSMARLNLNEISYKEILELMRRGIELLAKIRQQWNELVEFFVFISVRAEFASKQILKPFLDIAHTVEETGGEMSPSDRRFYLDTLSEHADEINRASYYLYTLASTYFDVSSRFLMKRMAGLAQMLATDSDDERNRLLAQLWTDAAQAQDAIKQLAQERRMESARLMQGRKEELQAIVDRFGPPSEIESEAIRNAYSQGAYLN